MIDPQAVKNQFPIFQQQIYGKSLVYLDNAATTHKPQSVLNSLLDFYSTSNSNIHRGVHYLSEQATAAFEASRQRVANFINAPFSEQVIFTHGATESINLLAYSFEHFLHAGDEILVSALEHHSNFVPWQMLCQKKKAVLKIIPIDKNLQIDVKQFKHMLHAKTKLVALTHVSNAFGVEQPIKELVAIAHSAGVPVLIDGAQAVPHLPIDVQQLDCDFYVFSGHKMYAAQGIGVLYGKKKWLEPLPPFQTGGGMIYSVSPQQTIFAEFPQKFEAGTPPIAAAVSLQAAIDFMQTLGFDDIIAHEQVLIEYLSNQLKKLPNITLYGEHAKRCGVVSFNLQHIDPYDAAMILDKNAVAIRSGTHCAAPAMQALGIKGTIRASLAVYNSIQDIDLLVDGLQMVQQMLGE